LSEKKPDAFLKLVFPKLYGVPADEAAENGLVADSEDLETGKDLINIINDWAKNRGKFQKGSNKNPVTGTGGKQKAEKPAEEEKAEEPAKTSTDKPAEGEPEEETEDKK
jgi:hypothetical protein